MGLLDKLPDSILGLGGNKPQNFGVDPTPPNSLHYTYSTTGQPNVKWRTISGDGMKPRPSLLDNIKDYWNSKFKYSDHKPK
jgi:hypothetical protein